jgi:segregation and condensation protein A
MQAGLPPGAPALEMASWTVMAAQLAELRSKLLLPADQLNARALLEQAEGQRRHWLGRAEMLAAADWLERRPQLRRDIFARGRPEPEWPGREPGLDEESTPMPMPMPTRQSATRRAWRRRRSMMTSPKLLRACLVALWLPAQADGYQPRRLPFWTVRDATARTRRMLGTLSDGTLLEAFLPEIASNDPPAALRCKAAHAATLIAGLELARDGGIALDQQAIWFALGLAERSHTIKPYFDQVAAFADLMICGRQRSAGLRT